jgi:hypothetical protein
VSLHFDDDVFDRTDADYVVLEVDGLLVPFFFEEYRFRSDSTAIVKFCDIDTQEQARELTNSEVFFPRQLSDSNDGDFWKNAKESGLSLRDAINYYNKWQEDNNGKPLDMFEQYALLKKYDPFRSMKEQDEEDDLAINADVAAFVESFKHLY